MPCMGLHHWVAWIKRSKSKNYLHHFPHRGVPSIVQPSDDCYTVAAFSLVFNQMKSGNTRQRAYQVLFIWCHWMPSGAASYYSYSNFEYECIDILTLQCQFVWRCSTRIASARLLSSKLTVLEPTTAKISNQTCKNLLVARIYCWDSNQAIWYANKYLAGEGSCQIMHLYPLIILSIEYQRFYE